jgi:hypothetical protein
MKTINTGSKDTRSGFGAGTELGQKKTWWHFVLI